jgi:hypothetical protein
MPPTACPEGTIRRKGYAAVRSATGKIYRVVPACVKDVGKPGKTPASQRIDFDVDFTLEPYGYKDIHTMNADSRHAALARAIASLEKTKNLTKHSAAVKVMRYVNLMFVLNKNTNITLSKTLERDRNWIGRTYLGKDYASA